MFFTDPHAKSPRLSLLASVVLMTFSVGVSQAQATEDNAQTGAIHYADSNTYTTATVLPDGTIIGSKTTNHGKGAVQTLRMPNLDNVQPKVNPVIGKDQNGNPIREREKKLRDLTWKQAAQLMKDYPFYTKNTIPAGTYNGQDEDVATVAVQATLIASNDVSEDAIYELTKALFDNLDELKTGHPKFGELTLENAIAGASVKLHPGAAKYYTEQGLDVSKLS